MPEATPHDPQSADPRRERWPIRDLSDPKALRALAHPLRLRLLEELALGGPATATQLAERLSESPANCSWHLRHLAQFGFVDEAGGGRGRQRPWRFVPRGSRYETTESGTELALAGEAVSDLIVDREYQALREWLAGSATADERWREAAFINQSLVWVTPAELRDLDEEVRAVLLRFVRRLADPGSRPAEARPVRLMAWGVPARPFPPTS